MMSTYILTALVVLLPLTFIPQAESGKPHAHPHPPPPKEDPCDSCVFKGFSCFSEKHANAFANITGLQEPADCGKFLMLFINKYICSLNEGRQCQNNLPRCVWWTMTDPGPLGATECFLLEHCDASINPLAFTGFNDCPPSPKN